MSKFAETFATPAYLDDYGYALSAEAYPTREEAAAVFRRHFALDADEILPSELRRDTVRWQFPSEEVGEPGKPWWEAGAGGRGSKAVWVWETG